MSVRFGLLGTGLWADTCHAPGLAAHPGVELIGVWGRDGAKAATLAERHGAAGEADLDALLAKVDAVAIAVAPAAQPELACRAADAGCHLLLEKPLALSPEAAGEIAVAVERAGVATITFFSYRLMTPAISWLRDSVAPAEWHGGTLTLLAPLFTTDNPFGRSPWRQQDAALWDAAPHALSLILPALGPIKEVAATRGEGEAVHLALSHEAGGISSVTVSLVVPEPVERFTFDLWGPAGLTQYPELGADADAYANTVSELLTAIETGVEPSCGIELSSEVVDVLAAAERFLGRPGGSRGERPEEISRR